MPSLSSGVIQRLGVVSDTLVPNDDGSCLVAHATREVLTADNVIEEEAEETEGEMRSVQEGTTESIESDVLVRFLLVVPYDALCVHGVNVQGLLPGDRVDDDYRVLVLQDSASEYGVFAVVFEFGGGTIVV